MITEGREIDRVTAQQTIVGGAFGGGASAGAAGAAGTPLASSAPRGSWARWGNGDIWETTDAKPHFQSHDGIEGTSESEGHDEAHDSRSSIRTIPEADRRPQGPGNTADHTVPILAGAAKQNGYGINI